MSGRLERIKKKKQEKRDKLLSISGWIMSFILFIDWLINKLK